MLTKTNKKLGNDFESAFCEILFENGFWVHNLAQNRSGQPADVLAVRNGKAYLIDCKVCSKRGFALSRIEENQVLSMELWEQCGNRSGWFALLVKEHIIMCSYAHFKDWVKLVSTLGEQHLFNHGMSFKDWLCL